MKRPNIAITFNVEADPTQSIWYNGGNQHCVFLYQMLKRWAGAAHVWLCYSGAVTEIPRGLMIDAFRADLRPIQEAIYETDLLIEMNLFLGPDFYEVLRGRGGKAVSYRFGNDYVIAVETVSLNAHDWAPNPHRTVFDEVWTNAQHMRTCASFFAAMAKAPVFELPHLWSPLFFETALARDPDLKGHWGYKPGARPKNIGLFEPNINVVKSAILPMLIVDEAFRRSPEAIGHVYMTNTEKLKENKAFKHMALGLDMVQAGRASADGRFPFVEFAGRFVDIIVTHQWENGLNYLFYEALHGGYPLVHNSEFLGDAGYHYDGFDIAAGADALTRALFTHDDHLKAYQKSAQAVLRKVNPLNPDVLAPYVARIKALFAGAKA
jgi:hypothetical protein